MKPRPGRTTNRLHFEDLDPRRFEDLAMAILFNFRDWVDIRHYGRSGADRGIDIFAKEPCSDGPPRTWLVQCRRYREASRADLLKALDDLLEHETEPPEVVLLAVGCDLSREAHEAFEAAASARGVEDALLWSASILEALLYSERRDLLWTYFGVSQVAVDEEFLSVDRIAILLSERYPASSRRTNEDYGDLLADFWRFGIRRVRELVTFLETTTPEVMRREREQARSIARNPLVPVATRTRAKSGLVRAHVGLARLGLEVAFPGEWAEMREREDRERKVLALAILAGQLRKK